MGFVSGLVGKNPALLAADVAFGFVALVVEPISLGLDSDVELAGRRIRRESRWSAFLSSCLGKSLH